MKLSPVMGHFEFIEHTADKGFRVEAGNLADLFETSVRGLAKLLREDLPVDSNQFSKSQQIEITAQDRTALLVDFLSEILTQCHIQKTVFIQAKIEEISPTKVRAHMYGIPVDYFDEVIKAVTYHQAEIKDSGNATITTNIIFDI